MAQCLIVVELIKTESTGLKLTRLDTNDMSHFITLLRVLGDAKVANISLSVKVSVQALQSTGIGETDL